MFVHNITPHTTTSTIPDHFVRLQLVGGEGNVGSGTMIAPAASRRLGRDKQRRFRRLAHLCRLCLYGVERRRLYFRRT